MKKYYFLCGVLLCFMIGSSLQKRYESFQFHAYETSYYKGMYQGENEHIKVSSLAFLQQGNAYEAGYGYIEYTDLNLEGLEIDLMVDDQKYIIGYEKVEEGKLHLSTVNPQEHGHVSLRFIYPNTGESEVVELTPSNYDSYQCHVVDYNITDFYIDEENVVFGYINAQDEALFEQYPNVTIEYDYKEEDHDVAFYAMTGNTADYLNNSKTVVDHVDFDLKDHPIIVIISLSNSEETHTIELELSKVGEQK